MLSICYQNVVPAVLAKCLRIRLFRSPLDHSRKRPMFSSMKYWSLTPKEKNRGNGQNYSPNRSFPLEDKDPPALKFQASKGSIQSPQWL